MSTSLQRLHALCLTGLLLCQAALAGSGGLQLCLASTGEPFQVVLNCNETDVESCCRKSPQESSLQANLGEDCVRCHDFKLEIEGNDPWLAGERGSPKLPVCIPASGPIPSRMNAPFALVFAGVYPKRGPPQVSDALRQFRDVVSLRI